MDTVLVFCTACGDLFTVRTPEELEEHPRVCEERGKNHTPPAGVDVTVGISEGDAE